MKKWMKKAIKEAKKGIGKNDGGPFGAVIVKSGKMISKAHNKVLSSKDPTAHAEIEAIRKASKKLGRYDLSDCELYTTSKPCPMCLGAVFWSRIKTVYYGTSEDEVASIGFDDKKFYAFLRGDKTAIKFIRTGHKKSLNLLKFWEQKKDKKLY